MPPRTPESKRVRIAHWQNNLYSNAVTDVGAYLPVSRTFMDDIRIIGFTLTLKIGLPDTPNVEEGVLDALASLSRASYTETDAILGQCQARLANIVEAAYESIWDTRVMNQVQNIMFPEGYGIDIDEGETLTLWAYGRQNILSSGNGTVEVGVIIYYVER